MAVGLGDREALEGVDVVGIEAVHVNKGAFVGPALDLASLADKAALEHELDGVDVDLTAEIDDDELGCSLFFYQREEKERFESACGHGKTGGKEEGGGEAGMSSFAYSFRVPAGFLTVVCQELFAIEGCFPVQD